MFEYFERSKGAKIVLENCFGVKPGKGVLIITDTKMIHTGEILALAVYAAEQAEPPPSKPIAKVI